MDMLEWWYDVVRKRRDKKYAKGGVIPTDDKYLRRSEIRWQCARSFECADCPCYGVIECLWYDDEGNSHLPVSYPADTLNWPVRKLNGAYAKKGDIDNG